MITTVGKYPLPIRGFICLEMPAGAEILHLATQNDNPFLWARVRPHAPLIERRFLFVGTGHGLPDEVRQHIGTILVAGDDLVFHLFEIKEDSEGGGE